MLGFKVVDIVFYASIRPSQTASERSSHWGQRLFVRTWVITRQSTKVIAHEFRNRSVARSGFLFGSSNQFFVHMQGKLAHDVQIITYYTSRQGGLGYSSSSEPISPDFRIALNKRQPR